MCAALSSSLTIKREKPVVALGVMRGCMVAVSHKRPHEGDFLSKEKNFPPRRLPHTTPTMPVYTVREVTGDAKPDSDLELRGLKARVVTMTQLDPIAVPDYPQIAYHLYSKLLPAFMVCRETTLPVRI